MNRRQFDTVAHAEWARFQHYGRPLSLLIVDIGAFKSINDRYGHDAGDAVIRSIAEACNANKRTTDSVGRGKLWKAIRWLRSSPFPGGRLRQEAVVGHQVL